MQALELSGLDVLHLFEPVHVLRMQPSNNAKTNVLAVSFKTHSVFNTDKVASANAFCSRSVCFLELCFASSTLRKSGAI